MITFVILKNRKSDLSSPVLRRIIVCACRTRGAYLICGLLIYGSNHSVHICMGDNSTESITAELVQV